MLLEEETPATFTPLGGATFTPLGSGTSSSTTPQPPGEASAELASPSRLDAPPLPAGPAAPLPIIVAEVFADSSAQRGGVLAGDLVRASTFMSMGMSYPAWQLMMGGIGKPTLQKALMPTAGAPFDQVLAAIASNAREQQGNGQVTPHEPRAWQTPRRPPRNRSRDYVAAPLWIPSPQLRARPSPISPPSPPPPHHSAAPSSSIPMRYRRPH